MTEAPTHPNYEANPRHYLRRAAELSSPGENESWYRALIEDVLDIPNDYRELIAHAKTLSLYEPLPDPDAKLLELAREGAASIHTELNLHATAEELRAGKCDHSTAVRSSLATLKLGLERGVIVMGDG